MWHRILIAALALAAAVPASAGVANTYARNRVLLGSSAGSEFSGGETTLTHGPVLRGRIADDPGVSHVATADTALRPSVGAAKDGASGRSRVTVLLQDGSADDLFDFEFSGSASASEAFMASGDPASARVNLVGTVQFFLDTSPTSPAGTVVGTLTLDALRTADPYEDFRVEVSASSRGVIRTILPGSAATTLALALGDSYKIEMKYTMTVPHGIDPDFAVQWGAGATFAQAVPEPSVLALAAAGLVLTGVAVRRRRR